MLVEWLANMLARPPQTLKPEELEERVDAIVARVDVLEERVETIERDLPIRGPVNERT
jgi:hypothetical protein